MTEFAESRRRDMNLDLQLSAAKFRSWGRESPGAPVTGDARPTGMVILIHIALRWSAETYRFYRHIAPLKRKAHVAPLGLGLLEHVTGL